MTHTSPRNRARLSLLAGTAVIVLAACNQPLDFDMRGLGGGFSTAEAAQSTVSQRPSPDERGVITYPNYQVAVADRGDTINSVATRLGFAPEELSRYNGMDVDVPLRRGEVIALPRRIDETSAAAQAGAVDIGALAGNAINRAPATPTTGGVRTASLPPAQPAPAAEPVRHKVERGETAYTVARLYGVPIKALAEWNGLGSDFAIREGQFLLIPVAKQAPPARQQQAAVTPPGSGSPTPTPPSAAQPLPKDDTATPVAKPQAPVADLSTTVTPTASAAMVFPVTGSIIREYAKGKNEGINIKAAAGSPVKAAEAGTVAAITQSGEGVPIIVVRHDANLLTVYANVADVSVKKGDSVTRGQSIAKLREGDDAYVHFEVRKGFDSVDPMPYLQ